VDGADLQGTAVAFALENAKKWPKRVEHAWRIDDKTLQFSKIAGKEIVCAP
jgi:hypothetical protein